MACKQSTTSATRLEFAFEVVVAQIEDCADRSARKQSELWAQRRDSNKLVVYWLGKHSWRKSRAQKAKPWS